MNGRTLAASALALIILVIIVSGCVQPAAGRSVDIPKPPDEALDSFDNALAETANAFGMALLRELWGEEENMLISPVSVATALAMTYNGARGDTKEAMAEVLQIEGTDLGRLNENNRALLYLLQTADPSIDLFVANSLWMRKDMDFDESFVKRNQDYYNAAVRQLDFDSHDAADIMNKWVLDNTGGRIEDIIEPPIHPLTVLFLLNAVYFKGDWTTPFDPKATVNDAFCLPGGERKNVPFMYRKGEMHYYEEDGFQAIRLSYGKEGKMAMYVFLPAEESGLPDFVEGLTAEKWQAWREGFYKGEGDLYLPRFSMEYEKTLNDALMSLGMEIAFDQNSADFFDMVPWEGRPRLFISEVKHKSFIEVSEKGTEAAAATFVEIKVESAPPIFFSMRVDRPFFFLISDDETGAILFMGTVSNPQ